MSALDAIGGRALAHPVTGEVVEYDDLPAIKAALSETEDYLRRPEVRRMWDARDALQARLGELDPITLPRPSKQTDRQRRVERCPRCKHVIEVSEPEPKASASQHSSQLPNAGAAEQPSGSGQSELLPRGPRTTEQQEALGVDIFGEPLEETAAGIAAAAAATETPDQEEALSPEQEEVDDGSASSLPLDPTELAGAIVLTRPADLKGKTVAEVVATEPDRSVAFVLGPSKDEKLRAAFVTWIHERAPHLKERLETKT